MIRQLGLSRGIHTDPSIGELLNPLRGVTPQEVKELERGGTPSRRSPSPEMIIIPMTPTKEERGSPPEGVEYKK